MLQGNDDTGVQRISDIESTEVSPSLNNLVLEHMLQLPGLDKEMIMKVRLKISVFYRAFFSSIIDKHQHMHFTFNNVLV